MRRIAKTFFVLLALYLSAHLAFWHHRTVERRVKAETLTAVNALLDEEKVRRFYFRVSDHDEVSMTYRRPSFAMIRAAAEKSGSKF